MSQINGLEGGLRRSSSFTKFVLKFKRHFGDVALISPFLALFVIFIAFPVCKSAFLSFTDYRGAEDPFFVGLANYKEIFEDDRFYRALWNSTRYMALASILSTVFGLMLAVAFGTQKRAHQIIRIAFFLPSVAGGVGVIAVWKYLANSEPYGLFNTLRDLVGLDPVRFLGDPSWAIPLLVMMAVWATMGYNLVIFVAGTRGISSDIYEAAALDGATPVQRFFYVTLPLLRPTIMYVLITGMISAFQMFNDAYIMFGSVDNVGGTLDSGLMLVGYLFDHGFRQLNFGYACAVAWILTTIIFVLVTINMRVTKNMDA